MRELGRGAARAAVELRSVTEPAAEERDTLDVLPTVPAAPATRLASEDELRGLCAAAGLEAMGDEVVAAARTSVRLTAAAGGGSRLGGVPDLPLGFEWPSHDGEELALLAQLRLDELPASPLPATGLLLVFFALGAQPSGLRAADAGSCRVVLVDEVETARADRLATLPEQPLAASAELTLPLDPPAGLARDVDPEAWELLRVSLAALHGLAPAAVASPYAIHRLLGHPDADAAAMALDAELLAHGLDAAGGERHLHPLIDRLERDAARRRLLLQLSPDDTLGLSFGGRRRLYVWIDEADLDVARLDDVRAFLR